MSLNYTRQELPLRQLTRDGWPQDIHRIRQVLPNRLADQRPPATAKRASWIVVARSDDEGVCVRLGCPVYRGRPREVLVAAASTDAWSEVVLDGNLQPPDGAAGRIFPQPGKLIKATPDIVIERRNDGTKSVPLLIEVKYKPAKDAPDRNDLDQTLAYALAYGASQVVIAQPKSRRTQNA